MNAKQVMVKYPDLHKWFLTATGGWPKNMMDQLRKYDRLTDKQLEVSLRIQNEEKQAAIQAERIRVANLEAQSIGSTIAVEKEPVPVSQIERPVLEIARIERAFEVARENGVLMPKMALDKFFFKAAHHNSANPGAIYITRGKHGEYLGKVLGGKLTVARGCTQTDVQEIQDIVADPEKAANAYGLRTGQCCICNRDLTAKQSVDDGIGPICREKFGWGKKEK